MKEYIERGKLIDDILHALLVVPSEDFLLPPEKDILRMIKSEPAADVRPVVLCRDCIFRSNEWTGCPKLNGTITSDEFFCKCGIKKRQES